MSSFDLKRLEAAAQLHAAGKLDEAQAAYDTLLKEDSQQPDLLNLYGVLQGQRGDFQGSIRYIEAAISHKSDELQYYWNLALAQASAGNRDNALQIYLDIGKALVAADNFEAALLAYRQGQSIDPANPQLGVSAGIALGRMHRWDECLAEFDAVLATHPDFVAAITNRGNALWGKGDWVGALRDYGRAAELEPENPVALLNYGFALARTGPSIKAVPYYEKALQLAPENAKAHFDYGLLMLMLGQYKQGFDEIEWRWHEAYNYKIQRRTYKAPAWQGEPAANLDGRLLLFPEQGYGDAIMLARYAPLLAERGYDILLETPASLERLFRQSFSSRAGITIVTGTTPEAALPASLFGKVFHKQKSNTGFAAYTGYYSLPGLYGTTLATIPAKPYLQPDPDLCLQWRKRVDAVKANGLKVGIVWSGDPRPGDLDAAEVDRQRSLVLAKFERFLDVPGIVVFSLQKGKPAEELKSSPMGSKIHDFMPEVRDFADTAALIQALDLVISVDTAVLNLSGAMGKAAWGLLRLNSDWRWGETGVQSDWYPGVRLFRQSRLGDWNPVLDQIRLALIEETDRHAQS